MFFHFSLILPDAKVHMTLEEEAADGGSDAELKKERKGKK